MKKYKKIILIASVIGLVIQGFGIGFMIHGMNNNKTQFWIGAAMVLIGLLIISIGLIIVGIKGLNKK